jgi:hypothetical protein
MIVSSERVRLIMDQVHAILPVGLSVVDAAFSSSYKCGSSRQDRTLTRVQLISPFHQCIRRPSHEVERKASALTMPCDDKESLALGLRFSSCVSSFTKGSPGMPDCRSRKPSFLFMNELLRSKKT